MGARNIFVTGGTGYIGRNLIPLLVDRGHNVRALVRKDSERKLPPGCSAVIGDALVRQSFVSSVMPSDTFLQLVGVAHPSPAKAIAFRSIDLISGRASIEAAAATGVRHFVYVSVAQPAPVMKVYLEVRAECEKLISDKRLNATILRPWYVLGEGHRWPLMFQPVYWLCERIPSTRESARRLGLVTLRQMLCALVHAVEHPAEGIRIVDVPQIRSSSM